MADERAEKTEGGKPVVIALGRNDAGTLEGALRQVRAVIANKDEVYTAIANNTNRDRLLNHMLNLHKGQTCEEAACGAKDISGPEVEADYVYDPHNKQLISKAHAEAVLGPDNTFRILP